MRFCSVCGKNYYALDLCKRHYYSRPEVKAKQKEYKSRYYSRPEVKAKQKAKWRATHYPKPTINEIIDKKIAERAEHLKKRGIYCRGILPRKYLPVKSRVD